ncbi:acetate--CoA ligase [Halomonas elongata]|uniref:Acetyl-coenzyme A synthetase n=1 Tax=Halomonas elongata (strain ATCC 33173 / DSM 2581 / NBRC 15536 / NCIMB 2198 / 1H9) TaxID=768066 RepID=E1V7K9_HALED|nr:acetate--CoA ligase [Halomonas elongata]MBW5799475.1 acetate--CoA ligase [Halomonas elongata]RAW08994.1 acetate--CoA ligase [Halomonas elongata]WBF17193.1 acetate--CoA ligase [Halomonas elongata]WPU46028.1 acetate--CoA ligase [Halomonas elongata DSM 2581]WVI70839.1 acetate--CoA ligase [Halomonas elongata]
MSDQQHIYPVRDDIAAKAWADKDTYQAMYQRSVDDPDGFWAEQARHLEWFKAPSVIKNTSFASNNVDIRWFEDGKLNASVNCLDRHLASRGDRPAIIWEGDDPAESKTLTYRQLHERTCQLANALKELGVGKGDTVTLYMPMVPEAAMAMLACARIGAVHSVVFGGFSPDALAQRVKDAASKVVITADESVRGGKQVPLKDNVDAALTREGTDVAETVLVLQRTGGQIDWKDGRDVWFHELVDKQSTDCPAEEVSAEDPLFILYTSGSTGAPKGLKHTTGGYLLQAALTHQYVFDYRDGEVYWCTADVGWVTGHSYIVYGPLANGATTLMFEGVPSYPTNGRMGEIVDKHQVSILYTAPTAVRALMAHGDHVMDSSQRDSLRLLGSVGEPINPEAWEWFYRVIGKERCPIVDTWWQTETGGIMIAPLPGAIDLKPGSATLPFFGVQPALVDNEGHLLEGATDGNLVVLDSWPGQARSIWNNHERFVQTYFSTYEGMYFTGDGCRRDEDGYYWITGRVDDVLNVSGHRMGTAEIESSLVAHEAVAEAAVVGYPHDIKGQGIYIYVTLDDQHEPSDELKKELTQWVRKDIGPIASPDVIQWAPSLPKTRSGKIMRRILRKIAANECDGLGDTSTLADPSVVDELIEHRANR